MVCVEGASGRLVWRTRLEDRANTGMALTGDLQVCGNPAHGDAKHACVDAGVVSWEQGRMVICSYAASLSSL